MELPSPFKKPFKSYLCRLNRAASSFFALMKRLLLFKFLLPIQKSFALIAPIYEICRDFKSMKKLAGILFLFLVAVLFAVVPTSYAYGCSQEGKEKTAESDDRQATHERLFHHAAERESHDDPSCPVGGCGDDCYCGCGCVHSQTSIFTGFNIKTLISTLLPELSLPEMRRNLALQSYHTDIWQPPKHYSLPNFF